MDDRQNEAKHAGPDTTDVEDSAERREIDRAEQAMYLHMAGRLKTYPWDAIRAEWMKDPAIRGEYERLQQADARDDDAPD